MFNGIEGIIKKLTIVLLALSLIGFWISGVVIGMEYNKPLIGFLLFVVGPLVSIICAVYAYGFGVLVENSSFILKSVRSIENKLSYKKDNESDTNNTVSKA